jgi:hypothetical protein
MFVRLTLKVTEVIHSPIVNYHFFEWGGVNSESFILGKDRGELKVKLCYSSGHQWCGIAVPILI